MTAAALCCSVRTGRAYVLLRLLFIYAPRYGRVPRTLVPASTRSGGQAALAMRGQRPLRPPMAAPVLLREDRARLRAQVRGMRAQRQARPHRTPLRRRQVDGGPAIWLQGGIVTQYKRGPFSLLEVAPYF